MPKVFVHGNPETADVWNELISALNTRGIDDIIRLSPPGFGAPVPDGFTGARTEYVDWLVGELEKLDGPIDLVGHDWGAGHVFGVLATEPELVRSWAADCLGMVHPDYVWHEMAQAWRTEGNDADHIAGLTMLDGPTVSEMLGVPADLGAKLASAIDETMGRMVLALYRSAPEAEMLRLGAAIDSGPTPPGLAIVAGSDPYVDAEYSREMAVRFGAELLDLHDQEHWWMTNPTTAATTADRLIDFWKQTV